MPMKISVRAPTPILVHHDVSVPLNCRIETIVPVDQHAEQRAKYIADAAGQQRPADHDRRDRVQFHARWRTGHSRRAAKYW